jgi:site-specific recombinase XerD
MLQTAENVKHKLLIALIYTTGIQRSVHLHMARHCFATHLPGEGKDIRYVQELPGQKSIKTNERYTHIVNDVLTNASSPFDLMMHKTPPEATIPGSH